MTSWLSRTPSLENRAAVTETANKDGETTRATREVNGRWRMERECVRKGEVQRARRHEGKTLQWEREKQDRTTE